MPIRWLALTGTPGVGKSSLARALRARGVEVVDGNRFAREHGCLSGVDRVRRSQIVDVRRVGRQLARLPDADGRIRILESHWAHAVPGMDAALVLRLEPGRLARRLRRRRWNAAKIRENVEAEILDIILQESVKEFGTRRVGELDVTGRSVSELTRVVARVLRAPERELMKLEIGRIDWTPSLLKWS